MFIKLLIILIAVSSAITSRPHEKYIQNAPYDHDITEYLIPKIERTYPKDIRMLAQGMHVNNVDYKAYFRYTLNVHTPGYKKTKAAKYNDGKNLTVRQYVVWKKERAVDTDRALDIYITGKKTFFTLLAPNGDEIYTHNGRLTLNEKNQLVTISHELPILGENGPIYLESDDVKISQKGEIKYRGEIIDKLKITTFSTTDGLWSYEGTLFYVHNPEQTSIIEYENYNILQGFYEASNEEPGYFSSKLMVPWFETTAYSAKKYLENFEKLFEAVEVKSNE